MIVTGERKEKEEVLGGDVVSYKPYKDDNIGEFLSLCYYRNLRTRWQRNGSERGGLEAITGTQRSHQKDKVLHSKLLRNDFMYVRFDIGMRSRKSQTCSLEGKKIIIYLLNTLFTFVVM